MFLRLRRRSRTHGNPSGVSSIGTATPLAIVMTVAIAGAASAQSSLAGSAGQAQSSPLAAAEAGTEVADVRVVLTGTTGDAARDQSIRQDVFAAAWIDVGDSVNAATLAASVQRISAVAGVTGASYRLVPVPSGMSLVFDVAVESGPAQAPPPAVFPVLYKNARSMLTLTLSGGMGVYSDTNAFFRNWSAFNATSPIAPGPPTGKNVTFTDISIEPGVAAIARISRAPVYAYGGITLAASGTLGPDIYQRNDSMYAAVEKGYGGLLWARSKRELLNASVGRQNYTLNDGFLVHHVKGSTNVGDRRALYLGARTAHDLTALVTGRYRRAEVRLFYLDPNEYEPIESNTRVAGANLRYEVDDGLRVDGSFIRIVDSDGRAATPQGVRVPRSGTSTFAAHVRWSNALGAPGLFLESEAALQRHSTADVHAYAGYGTAGYRFTSAIWKPAVVVRYASWSGDDPETARYERWDPLLPAGSDEWMGGVIFSKYVANSNLRQLRVRGFAQPATTFNFTVDWFRYQAAELNNLGANPVLGTLTSPALGQELMFIGRQFLGKNYFIQTLASINSPGEAVRDVMPERTKRWVSLQASLYWFF